MCHSVSELIRRDMMNEIVRNSGIIIRTKAWPINSHVGGYWMLEFISSERVAGCDPLASLYKMAVYSPEESAGFNKIVTLGCVSLLTADSTDGPVPVHCNKTSICWLLKSIYSTRFLPHRLGSHRGTMIQEVNQIGGLE